MKRILLLGKTGAGKSRTGNTIFGDNSIFASKCQASSLTKECQKHTKTIRGNAVTIVDTPGIFDTEGNINVKRETEKCFDLSSPGPHVLLLIVRCGRSTKEDFDALQICKSLIGGEISTHSIIVFTYFDEWKRDSGDSGNFERYINTLPTGFQNFIKTSCGNRYVPFDNTLKGVEAEPQVNALFVMIDEMLQNNSGVYMSSENYKNCLIPGNSENDEHSERIQDSLRRRRKEHEQKMKKRLNHLEHERMEKINAQSDQIERIRQNVGEGMGPTVFRFIDNAGQIIRFGGTIYSIINGTFLQPAKEGLSLTANGLQYTYRR